MGLTSRLIARFKREMLRAETLSVIRRAAALLILSTAITLACQMPAHASGPTDLLFSTPAGLLADAHGHVFAVGGSGTTSLAVMDTEGRSTGSISIAGPSGMVLVGDDLYVSAADAAAIDVVNTAVSPPVIERTISVAPSTQPSDITFVAGMLWVFVNIGPSGPSPTFGLIGIDPDGTGQTNAEPTGMIGPRFVSGSPSDGHLTFFESGANPSAIVRYDVAGGVPRHRFQVSSIDGGTSIHGATYLPDGTIVAGATGHAVQLRPRDLAVMRRFPTDTASSSVTVAPSGDLVFAGMAQHDGAFIASFAEYPAGALDHSWSFAVRVDYESPVAIAWSPDESHVYAVMQRSQDPSGPLVLLTLHPNNASLDQDLAFSTPSIAPPGGAHPTVAVSRSDALERLAILVTEALIGVLVGYLARRKGRSFGGWWALGFLFGLLALLVVILVSRKAPAPGTAAFAAMSVPPSPAPTRPDVPESR